LMNYTILRLRNEFYGCWGMMKPVSWLLSYSPPAQGTSYLQNLPLPAFMWKELLHRWTEMQGSVLHCTRETCRDPVIRILSMCYILLKCAWKLHYKHKAFKHMSFNSFSYRSKELIEWYLMFSNFSQFYYTVCLVCMLLLGVPLKRAIIFESSYIRVANFDCEAFTNPKDK
jgi:hypothetical protein